MAGKKIIFLEIFCSSQTFLILITVLTVIKI